ncbi:MAG: tail tape measure protein [Alphaproteobacteria bacterium]|nr:tail tape measure protein [Alphaproteobacteria bacterium]
MLRSNVAAVAKGMGDAIRGMADRSDKDLGRVGRAAQLAGGAIDSLGNRYTALITGAAGLGTAKMLVDQEMRFTRLGIAADMTADQVDAMRRQILQVANMPDIRVDSSEITAAIEQILEKTGNLELARDNIRNIGLAIQATGAAGADVGSMFADAFEKFGIKDSAQILAATDAIAAQGKAGAFTLANLATQGSRVTSAYAVTGRQGVQAMTEMGAALQMIRRGVSSPEQAATAFEALLRTLQDADKVKMLKAGGIQIMDPKNPKVMRSVIDIMQDIIKKTGGDALKLSQVFDSEAMRAFNGAVAEFKQTGGFESFGKFLDAGGDGSTLLTDSARAAKEASAAMQSLKTVYTTFSTAALTGPIRFFADQINGIKPENLERAMRALAWGAAGVGALVVGVKAIQGIRATKNAIDWVRGAGQPGAAPGRGAGPAGAGIVAVRVTNWPQTAYGRGTFGTAMGGDLAPAGRGRLGARLGGLSRLALPAGAAMAALQLGMVATDANASTGEKIAGGANVAGQMAGAWAGGKLGALLGSLILPGAGTVAGGVLGAGAGALFGGEAAEALANKLAAFFQSREDQKVGVDLRIETPAGVSVSGMRASDGADLATTLSRGPGMVMP